MKVISTIESDSMVKSEIKDTLKEHNISICFFDGNELNREGFFVPSLDTVFVNNLLPEKDFDRVILHELGHIKHSKYSYDFLSTKLENEANRFMIKKLLNQHLEKIDIAEFNIVQFAKANKLNTLCDEAMIQDELKKILSK